MAVAMLGTNLEAGSARQEKKVDRQNRICINNKTMNCDRLGKDDKG